jgi:hypothetical protein
MSPRSRGWWLLAALLVVAPCAARAEGAATKSTTLGLRVVDVADDRAYLEPGASAGVAVGDEVTVGGVAYRVAAVSSSFTMVSLQGKTVTLGSRGTARIARAGERADSKPEPPAPLSAFRTEWRPAASPAASQTPQSVPLGGSTAARGPSRAWLSDAFYGVLPQRGEPAFFGNQLRARLHYEPFFGVPFSFDADAALQTFWGDGFDQRPGAGARQLLRLRELRLTYGDASSFRGSLGRLRAASSFAGQLDGLRLEAPLTSALRLAAYGGAVPHAVSGALSPAVTRFGADLTYHDVSSSLRPRLVAGGYVSRFDGALDEKKAFASVDLLPDGGRLGGHAQLSFYEPDNPWGASRVELARAGVDAEVDVGPFHFGGRAQLERPERSRFLATLLPREWLCWASPSRASATCSPSDAVYSWLLDGGVRAGKLSVDLGGQSVFTRGTDASSFGGFAHLRWLDVVGHLHWDGNVSVTSGSVLRSASLLLSPGLSFGGGRGDVSLRYRPAVVRYRATLESEVEHSMGASVWLAPTDTLDLDLEADWLRAREIQVVVVQGIASFSLGL